MLRWKSVKLAALNALLLLKYRSARSVMCLRPHVDTRYPSMECSCAASQPEAPWPAISRLEGHPRGCVWCYIRQWQWLSPTEGLIYSAMPHAGQEHSNAITGSATIFSRAQTNNRAWRVSESPTSMRSSTGSPRSSHSAHKPPLPGGSVKGKRRSKGTALRSFRCASLERSVSALAVAPFLRRRPSDRVPGRRKLCRHLQRRSGGDPHAGRSPEHQLQRDLGAPRQPPGCRWLALGLSRECGWDRGVRCVEGVWTGSGSAVRVVAGLSN
jgi:hypothetical protein